MVQSKFLKFSHFEGFENLDREPKFLIFEVPQIKEMANRGYPIFINF